MPVSMDDIARLAGVSRPTVSKALTGKHYVNQGTRDRIRDLAKQLNFVPSRAAQSLGNGKTGMIGVVYRGGAIPDAMSINVLNGMERAFRQNNLHLVIITHDESEADVPLILRQRFLDAAVIFHQRDQRDEAFMLENDIPFMVVNAEPTPDVDCISPDNRAGLRKVVDHLIELGHERIAYVNTPTPRHMSVRDRVAGYIEAMAAAGLPAMPGFNEHPSVEQRVEELLSLPNPPTAMVCYNDLIAIGAIGVLLDRKIDVPGKISVTGCDDSDPFLQYFRPQLSTLRLPFEEMGERAGTLLIERMNNPSLPARHVALPMELKARASTSHVNSGLGSE